MRMEGAKERWVTAGPPMAPGPCTVSLLSPKTFGLFACVVVRERTGTTSVGGSASSLPSIYQVKTS